MSESESNEDIAGKSYWDTTERNIQVRFAPFDPFGPGIRNFAKRAWHRKLQHAVSGLNGGRFLELGCGGSAFLPYFSRYFNFEINGIDYSESGCELARQMCSANGVSAEIKCADFFQAPESFEGAF